MTTIAKCYTRSNAAKMVKRPYSTICMWCRDMGYGDKLSLSQVNTLIARSEHPASRRKNKHHRKESSESWLRVDTVAVIVQDEGGEMSLFTREDFMIGWLDTDIQERFPHGIFHEVSAVHKAITKVVLNSITADDAKDYAEGA